MNLERTVTMVTLSNYGYESKFLNDGFNREGKRCQRNTKYDAYNCGGFALGTFSWYAPYGADIVDYAFDHGFIDEEEKSDILSVADEDEYYWDEQDFLESWNERTNNNGVPSSSTHNIPTYDCWANIQIYDRLESYCDNIFKRDSGFMEYFIGVMLREIEGLRVINTLDDLKDNEYCIAFRVGGYDFHYIRSNNSKCETWIGKMGNSRVKELPNVTRAALGSEKFFDFLFGSRYNSDTILFAKVA